MGDNPDRSEQVAALEERLEDVVETVEQQAEQIDALEDDLEEERERRRALEDENAELRSRLDDVEQRPEVNWDGGKFETATVETPNGDFYPLGRAMNARVTQDDLEQELTGLRDRLEDGGDLADESKRADAQGPTVTAETPLEQIVDLPEPVAESELTENQQRARFVAQGVRKFAKKAPAGYTLAAGELGRVLAAGTDTEPHSETIARVMGILEDLGGDDVDVVKRRGTKRVVFDDVLVERLAKITDEAHAVVSPSEA